MFTIGNLFGGNKQPQQMSPQQAANPALQANQPATPGNIPAVNNMPANPANPTVPVVAAPTEPQGMDKFKDVWNIKPEDMPKDPESPFAGVTPEAIAAYAAKTDFTKVITPDMIAKISAGGEEATAAMMQALNLVAQEGYATNAQASMRLIDNALAKQREQMIADLPNLIKSHSVSNNLRTENPIFNHPAAAPMLDMFSKQLQLKNPSATADQIKQQAQEFLLSFAQSANPPKVDNSSKQKGKTTDDWSDFLA